MNKKGFTLAELIGVVIILGLIVLLVVTPILSQINNQSEKIDNLTKEILFSTVETYIDENPIKYIYDSNKDYYISVGLLIEKGYLEENILNKYNEDTLSKNTVIKVTNSNDSFAYEILTSAYNTLGQIAKGLESSTFTFLGGKYFKNAPTNSYVVFNNILHKIMGINSDGTVKIISIENVTRLIPDNYDTYSYNNSYVRAWLNNYYYQNLLDNDYISKQEWCIDKVSTIAATTECNNKIEDYVGLPTFMEMMNLDDYESNYYNYKYITMTRNSSSDNFFHFANSIHVTNNEYPSNVRPVVNILPSAIVLDGAGSIDNPYILLNDPNVNYENVRLKDVYHSIGQYISYNSFIYRIMEIGAGYVKLVMVPTSDITLSSYSTAPSKFNLNQGLGYLLNTTLRSNFIPSDESLNLTLDTKFYSGEYTPLGSHYKSTSLLKTNELYGVVAAPAKLGEILGAAPIKCYTTTCSNTYWLLTETDSNKAYTIPNANGAFDGEDKSNTYSVIPTIYISNDGIIISGAGTQSNPFVMGGK